ncbi:disulfide bond formation protein B [Marinomonas balearica]|uniref:Disulfide bond formation protein B n=1 Tax=Marinomonas balearica TaxID=491947 RepID=A0A4R6M5C3_9GAMM|nr:disulfide bond formation protein B [Marinomonas balearica]TDO95965.1 disulfide bond formation protein DsbB [Marinomonas balearica]
MRHFITVRNFHLLIAVTSLSLLGVAFYMEYAMGLEPCPLCMLQRIMFFIVAIAATLSALHKAGRKFYLPTIITFAAIGAGLSIRHLYLQSLPFDELPACLPGLSYMFEVFPWQEIMQAMVMGTGECGDTLWTFLGLSIPGWTLVAFTSIVVANLVISIKFSNQN